MDAWISLAKAISDRSRLRILKMLEPGELCVCQITDTLGLAQSTVSKHLSQLRQANLVTDRKQGLWVYYRLHHEHPAPAQKAFLALVRASLNDDPQIVADAKARRACDCSDCEA